MTTFWIIYTVLTALGGYCVLTGIKDVDRSDAPEELKEAARLISSLPRRFYVIAGFVSILVFPLAGGALVVLTAWNWLRILALRIETLFLKAYGALLKIKLWWRERRNRKLRRKLRDLNGKLEEMKRMKGHRKKGGCDE